MKTLMTNLTTNRNESNMCYHSIKHIVMLCLIAAALACPSVVRAEVVLPGWNLFRTLPASYYFGTNWQGVPLGTFDFGLPGSPPNVDGTDTIIQRLSTITSPDVPSPIEVVALQLRTVDQVNFGAGVGYYYATLNTTQRSLGTMTIDSFPTELDDGIFHDSFNVYFDVRFGGLGGPIVAPGQLLAMSLTDAPWGRDPTGLTLTDINYLLNRTDTSGDFWPVGGTGGAIDHDASGAGHHVVKVTPEPTTMALLILGGLSLLKRRNA